VTLEFLDPDLRREVQSGFDAVKTHWDESLRPRLHDFMLESAGVEVRAAMGFTVDQDRLALRVWAANMTVEQQTLAGNAVKDAALRTLGLALSVLIRLKPV
jgi:hypothetical protein